MSSPAPKASLAPRALYQEVAERLRAQIFNRDLEPGSWIDELKICQELGISRTPLREALKVLAAEGLVTMKVRRGAYVTEMSEQDVREAYQLLALLESDAAARVCELASESQMQELQDLHQDLVAQTAKHEAFFASNERFHLRILEIEGNRWRQQIVTDLRRVMKLNRHHSLFKQGRIQDSLAEHEALIAALTRRDAQAASELMRNHFQNGLNASIPAQAQSRLGS
ncbi:GntR family transcriptional regulator [Paucibacter sp. KBW04]|uniref:GntR family transcriptional regulator n=1 Tax=Paucibacter sp. KBW04 TaxID=2153361 RepID=UPI000F581821|nr:GntR family transcriptional regulator [Paucibacter sp. KBW04]RQO58750.1 GntR family transcriptional regulator [Paucibacter sp. KBW04]